MLGFLGSSAVKNPPAIQEMGFYPWVSKIPGGGNGKPLQYSCLGNPIDKRVGYDLAAKQ